MPKTSYYIQFTWLLLSALILTSCADPSLKPTEPNVNNPNMVRFLNTLDMQAESSSVTIGEACAEPSDCDSRLCFTEIDSAMGICVQSCVDESDVCNEGFTCQTYANYGSICMPNSNGMMIIGTDMEVKDIVPDLETAAPDMSIVNCSAQDVYFTNSGGVEVGRLTLSTPNESQDIVLRSMSNRRNRARVMYNADCTSVNVQLLEPYPYLCLDFSQDPCADIPDQNCGAAIIWYFNNEQTRLGEDVMCRSTPEEQGWTQYHTMIQSCWPNYNGSDVTRFEVGYYNFPLCDHSLRGAHWCVGTDDGSPSRCLRCEENLYICL